MCAVHEMLIPIQAEYYALEGLGQLINTIGLVQEHFNPSLLVSTMLITMFDKRTLLSREVHDESQKSLSDYRTEYHDSPNGEKYRKLQAQSKRDRPTIPREWERLPIVRPHWKSHVARRRC